MFKFFRSRVEDPQDSFESNRDIVAQFVEDFSEKMRRIGINSRSLQAFDALRGSASMQKPAARDLMIDALSVEHSLPVLPPEVKETIVVGRDSNAASEHTLEAQARAMIRSVQGVFFTLANPEKPGVIFVAGLVKPAVKFSPDAICFEAEAVSAANGNALLMQAQAVKTAPRPD